MEANNTATTVYNVAEKLTSNERLLITGLVCVSVMTLYKIRSQHKQLTQMLSLAGEAVTQVGKLTKNA